VVCIIVQINDCVVWGYMSRINSRGADYGPADGEQIRPARRTVSCSSYHVSPLREESLLIPWLISHFKAVIQHW